MIDLAVPRFPPSQPGQFLELLCRPADDPPPTLRQWPPDGFPSLADKGLRESQAFLRRPFSIADHSLAPDGTARLRIISRTVGPGTRWLERLQVGDVLNLTGPLGRGFQIRLDGRPIALVGGGVGIPPLMYLTRRLHDQRHADVTVFFGVQTHDLLPVRLTAEPTVDATPTPCVELPGSASFGAIITSDDGSIGFPGLVTDALRAWHSRRATHNPPPLVLACGPEQMLRAVAELTRELGMPCQLCIERHMGCGMGTCLSCVVRARDDDRLEGWRWALSCQEGPVFERDELLDYGAVQGA